jgi:threonine synthase
VLPRPLLERYAAHLPITSSTPRLTLGEGDTPLVRAPALESRSGVAEVWLKVEGQNPTGSFKDRGMVVAVAKAMEEGARAVLCASTGNTAASAAAYAARAGLRCIVLLPEGQVALGKLAQAQVFGARVLSVEGSFDDAFRVARELAADRVAALVNSVNPHRIEGQKTAAFEVCEALGDAPDALAIPVGNAGNITAYWKGFREAAESGLARGRPRMWGFQAAGAAPIVAGHRIPEPQTVASAIRIGDPASWEGAVAARDESGGVIEAVSDEAILAAQRLLSAREGVFVEPASAASVAGLLQRHQSGALEPAQLVVATVTGHGLKDTETALSQLKIVTTTTRPDVASAAAALGL